MSEPKQFINPYAHVRALQADNPTRLNVDILEEDYNFIRCIRPSGGTMTTVIGILYQKLIHELKRRNITDITHRKQFEQFIVNCRLTVDPDGSTTRSTHQQTNAPDDAGRETGGGAEDSNSAHKQSSLPSGTQGRAGRGSKASRSKSV